MNKKVLLCLGLSSVLALSFFVIDSHSQSNGDDGLLKYDGSEEFIDSSDDVHLVQPSYIDIDDYLSSEHLPSPLILEDNCYNYPDPYGRSFEMLYASVVGSNGVFAYPDFLGELWLFYVDLYYNPPEGVVSYQPVIYDVPFYYIRFTEYLGGLPHVTYSSILLNAIDLDTQYVMEHTDIYQNMWLDWDSSYWNYDYNSSASSQLRRSTLYGSPNFKNVPSTYSWVSSLYLPALSGNSAWYSFEAGSHNDVVYLENISAQWGTLHISSDVSIYNSRYRISKSDVHGVRIDNNLSSCSVKNPNSQLDSSIGEYDKIESEQVDNMVENLGKVDTSNPVLSNNGFVNSSKFLATQLNNIYNIEPFKMMSTYSLVIGLALIIVGIGVRKR